MLVVNQSLNFIKNSFLHYFVSKAKLLAKLILEHVHFEDGFDVVFLDSKEEWKILQQGIFELYINIFLGDFLQHLLHHAIDELLQLVLVEDQVVEVPVVLVYLDLLVLSVLFRFDEGLVGPLDVRYVKLEEFQLIAKATFVMAIVTVFPNERKYLHYLTRLLYAQALNIIFK